jgi:hypothetical protein
MLRMSQQDGVIVCSPIANLYLEAQNNSHTSVNRWDQAVQDMDDDDFESVRMLFQTEEWPAKYGVPYRNPVALVKLKKETS